MLMNTPTTGAQAYLINSIEHSRAITQYAYLVGINSFGHPSNKALAKAA
jgi:hypothetical protein